MLSEFIPCILILREPHRKNISIIHEGVGFNEMYLFAKIPHKLSICEISSSVSHF